MGNICSRNANETDNFNQPGRVVGTNPSQNAAPRASVPAKANWKATPGRTLGESDSAGAGPDEARANAAIAAQVRMLFPLLELLLTVTETRRGIFQWKGQAWYEIGGSESTDPRADVG